MLFQALFAAVVLVSVVIVLLAPGASLIAPLVVGGISTAAVTGAALTVPWNRLAAPWSAVLPMADIFIVATLRESAPNIGFSLLWLLPAMWMASALALPGLVLGTTLITGLYWASLLIDPRQSATLASLLVPLTVAVAATAAYVTARRASAQRALLERQGSQLERAFLRARRQEDLVTEVLDAVDFGVMRITSDGAVSLTNDAHARIQERISDMRAQGSTLYDADGVSPVPDSAEPIARAARGEAFERERIWYGAPGEHRLALSVTARRVIEDGIDVGVLIVSQDVTREEMALRARDELVASVSHELRTPLTSILGYADLALDGDLDEPTRRSLDVIERNASRLLTIVSDILTSSREGAIGPKVELSAAKADLADIVFAAVESALPRALERGIEIDTEGVASLQAVVDPLRVRQVIDNLIGNAISYHSRDDGHVWVRTFQNGSDAIIEVRDDGPGMGADDRDRVFERYYRGKSSRAGGRGTGLGLAISRDFARAHGGDLTAHSVLGEGSVFTVRLPGGPREEHS